MFTLAGDQAAHGASGAAILTAWGISGVGVFCLVMTFFGLSRVKPELKGGIYSYASSGIRRLLGIQQRLGLLDQRAAVHGEAFRRFCSARLPTSYRCSAEGNNLASVVGASASCGSRFWCRAASRK